MANKYKRSRFTGIDVCLKNDGTVGPNLTMLKVDMSTNLPFASETFDFVFCRNLSLAIPFDDWDRTIGEISRVAKYNAYLEFMEADW
jgi:ubiquinone/menaquinone biosynthesis C-methylase UbiE